MQVQELPTVAYYNRTSSAVPHDWSMMTSDNDAAKFFDLRALQIQQQKQKEETDMATNRRIVQVYIADTNENVPLEKCVLYKGDEKLTDATDQELFFESNIADKLKAHNEERVKWLDKEATKRSGRDVNLEPAKIRELKMVVVTVAQL